MRFHFHLIEDDAVLHDEEGCDHRDRHAARDAAIDVIRRMVALEIVEHGECRLDRALYVDVANGGRERIGFADAIDIHMNAT